MKRKENCQIERLRRPLVAAALILFLFFGSRVLCRAQLIVGAITGTVLDSSGATVSDAVVKARNVATNLEVTVHSKSNGSYSISNLPVGTYEVSFAKEGFETETHTEILVTSDRTATVDGKLKVGSISTTVEVTAVPLMNQVDFFPYYEGPPQIPPFGSLGMIQRTIGSPRFLQLSLHLIF